MGTLKVAGRTFGVIAATMLVLPMGAAVLMWLADGDGRGGFLASKVISVRFIVAVLLLMVLLVPFFWVAEHRTPGTPMTWAEAMVAASYVFFVLFWLYGVVPHEFLNWADSELAWRPDKKIIGPEGSWADWWGVWKDIPMTIHKQTVRDLIAVLLYVVGLGGFVWGFAFWNDRLKRTAAEAGVERVSAYGRPLVAKAKG